jgi:hypothetical protein
MGLHQARNRLRRLVERRKKKSGCREGGSVDGSSSRVYDVTTSGINTG